MVCIMLLIVCYVIKLLKVVNKLLVNYLCFLLGWMMVLSLVFNVFFVGIFMFMGINFFCVLNCCWVVKFGVFKLFCSGLLKICLVLRLFIVVYF